jgi:serine/threonine protein kinase
VAFGEASRSPGPDGGDESLFEDLVEELTDRLQAGDAVDVESFLARHPAHAERLRRLIPSLELMDDLGQWSIREGNRVGPPPTDPSAGLGELGDYRILREVGRGGMGIVYEAEQVSLGRRVALKLLPMAAAMDPRQIQRFRVEAQAAACLHHPHIVPVHGVGCERGVHYYAMQLIDGRSLAAMIAELRRLDGLDPGDGPAADLAAIATSDLAAWLLSGGAAGQPGEAGSDSPTISLHTSASPPRAATLGAPPAGRTASSGSSTRNREYIRNAARLALQAAEALDHSHTRGILHRDIKPANLLLDAEGRLWVTDFGLAQVRGDDRLTLTGDVLGTLRYMSPEQALGQRVVIDGRTDVYSLGVTLYELLTLRPAVDGRDRAEILRRIADAEPPPLRRVNPTVPADLETIVLKATAKKAAGRYATAQELAEDLRSFLEDRPIRARRPGLLDRAGKWSRRHRSVVTTAAVVLVLGTAVSTWQAIRAVKAERKTAAALKVAEERRRQARQAVDTMFTRVAEEWLAQRSEMEPIQREFLESALQFYQQLVLEEDSDPEARKGAAQAYLRIGKLQERLGLPGAEQSFRQAVALSETLAREAWTDTSFRKVLAAIHNDFGIYLAGEGRRIEAEREYGQAIEIQETLLAELPKSRFRRRELARSYTNLGGLLRGLAGRAREAEEAHRKSVTIRKGLVAERPDDPVTLTELGASLHNLALTRQAARDLAEARELLQEAIYHQQAAIKLRPRDPKSRHFLRNHVSGLADVLRELGKPDEAITTYRHALELDEALVKDYPLTWDYQLALAGDLKELANFLNQDAARQQEAGQYLLRALDIHKALPRALAQTARNQSQLGAILNGLVPILRNRGQPGKARQLLQEAVVHQKAALEAEPNNLVYRRFLQNHRALLVLTAAQLGDPSEVRKALSDLTCTSPEDYLFKLGVLTEAGKEADKLREGRDPLVRITIGQTREVIDEATHHCADEPRVLNKAAWILVTCDDPGLRDPVRAARLAQRAVDLAPRVGSYWNTLGVARYRVGQWKSAAEAFEKSMALRSRDGGTDRLFLAMAHWQLGDRSGARKWHDRAVEWMDKNRPQDVELKRFRAEVAALLGVPELPADVFAGP